VGIEITGGVVRNCVANNNNIGIVAMNSIVTHCTANNNGDGIRIADSIVNGCTAIYNETGVTGSSNPGNRTERNNVRNNYYWGIYLWGENNYAIRNVGSDNGTGPTDNFTAGAGNYLPLTGDNANYGF
jgi:parallel beta-helix repeat protein